MKKFVTIAISMFPVALLADTNITGLTAVNTLVNKISDFILKPLILLMFALATLVFIWGVKNFIGAADDAEARSKGSSQMIWGMVGMVVMISAYAIKEIILGTVKML